jgi:hypothetical protein
MAENDLLMDDASSVAKNAQHLAAAHIDAKNGHI